MAAANYREMWKELGLDLNNHDALLSVLGKAYGDLFVSRTNRPQGMAYLDFVMSEIHGLRIKELVDARAAGRIVVGAYCTFAPEELVLAVGGICVGLCAGAEFATDQVEQLLPRNTCALIKSSLGFKLGKVCPYLEACNLVVGENTCDGKKKAYEVFGKIFNKPFHILDLPNTKTGANATALLAAEYAKFLARLEEVAGKKATPESLAEAIKIVNAKRAAVQRLAKLRAARPCPIAGLDALLVNQVFFYDDPVRFTEKINLLCDELEKRNNNPVPGKGFNGPRILLSGCPMSVPNWKIPALVESAGAVIVGEESCVGARGSRGSVNITGATTIPAMISALVERYMQIDCAVFSPNPTRLEHIKQMADELHADGVMLYGLHFCSPYLIEAMDIEKQLEKSKVPAIRIETDYSSEDSAQLKTRIEAFLERIKQSCIIT